MQTWRSTQLRQAISRQLPIPPHTSLYLPISPYICLYLPQAISRQLRSAAGLPTQWESTLEALRARVRARVRASYA